MLTAATPRLAFTVENRSGHTVLSGHAGAHDGFVERRLSGGLPARPEPAARHGDLPDRRGRRLGELAVVPGRQRGQHAGPSGGRHGELLPGAARRGWCHRRSAAPQAFTPQRQEGVRLRLAEVRERGQRRDRRKQPQADRRPRRRRGWLVRRGRLHQVRAHHRLRRRPPARLAAQPRQQGVAGAPGGGALWPQVARQGLGPQAQPAVLPGRNRVGQHRGDVPRRPRHVATARGGRHRQGCGEPLRPSAPGVRDRCAPRTSRAEPCRPRLRRLRPRRAGGREA